ncbi:MAG: heavy-metal-associated domain-containing protein [Weeksellaceae bacterium]
MKVFKFKTNINCSGCVAGVTPYLNRVEDIKWSVDIQNPDKILTVETGEADEEKIEKAVQKAGYKIEKM